jgi:hypothetical protein
MNFENALLESIDEGLSLLGESPKQAVYYHLEKNFNMRRQDIPRKIDEFTEAIEKIFGAGAKIIEIQIMKCLFKKVGHNFRYYPKQISLAFTDYIAAVKTEKGSNIVVRKKQLNTNRQRGTCAPILETVKNSIKRDFQEILNSTCVLKTDDF